MIYRGLNRLRHVLPAPIKRVLKAIFKPLLRNFYRAQTYDLTGDLAGMRMQGQSGIVGPYLGGSYERGICDVITKVVQPGWTCVDAGAHAGYMTLLLARQVGSAGQVISFEAHPDNARTVQANVLLNDFDLRVKVENMAVAGELASSVKLFAGRGRNSSEWNIVGHDVTGLPTESYREVPATSLDTYFAAGSRLDFVKMDIEGAEAQALPGMKRLLNENQPVVLVEFHDQDGWASRSLLLEAGYHLYDIQQAVWLADALHAERVYHCLAVPQRVFASLHKQL